MQTNISDFKYLDKSVRERESIKFIFSHLYNK